MFGLSFAELVVVLVVAIVVIGPRDMPKLLRKLGQYAGKLRRMAADLRAQSGIDDVLRTEGLGESVAEIRKLARGELDSIQRDVEYRPSSPLLAAGSAGAAAISTAYDANGIVREYPVTGADAYGALPEHSQVYDDDFPKSDLARDPLYVLGDASGVLPPEPEPPAPEPPTPFESAKTEVASESPLLASTTTPASSDDDPKVPPVDGAAEAERPT